MPFASPAAAPSDVADVPRRGRAPRVYPNTLRNVVQTILIAAILAASVAFSAPQLAGKFLDFRAFYCAGQATLSGADPYLEHPLHECEARVALLGRTPSHYGATLPAPFPAFVLTVFAGLALLPYECALWVWESGACLALALSIVLFARVTRTSLTANAVVLGFPAVVLALQFGQVTPFVMLAVAGAARLLQLERARLAGLASLGAMLDPHVGLALVLGIFAAVPRARGVLVAGTVALVGIDVRLAGPQREWEYVHSVIPAHALANISEAAQFSTANFAFEAGAPPPLAMALGTLWYVAALFVGILVAHRLRNRLGIAAIACVPVAFAVFGGTHTHLQQLAIGVPAFMLLASQAAGISRAFLCVVTFVAAIPWLFVAPFPWLFAVPVVLAMVFAREMNIRRQGIRLAAGSFAALVLMMFWIFHSHIDRNIGDVSVPGNPLAEVSFQIYTIARYVPTDSWFFVAKAPTVIAFGLLFAALIRSARQTVPSQGALTV